MRTMRSTLSRSPTAACSVPSRSMRDGARRLLAGGACHVAAELADPGLAVALGDVAGEEDEIAAAHERHVGAGRNRQRRQGDVEVGEAVVDRGHGAVCRAVGSQIVHPWPLHFGRCEHRRPARRLAALMLAWLAGVARPAAGARALAVSRLPRGRGGRHRRGARWPRLAPSRRRRSALAGVRGALLAGFALTGGQASLRLGDDARRPRSRAATSSSPASSPACRKQGRAGCAFASTLDARVAAHEAGELPPRIALGWYGGFHEDAALVAAAARAARRPALALHRAAAPAARQPQPARLRLRAAAVRAGRARHRLRARRAARRSCSREAAGFPVERLRQRVRDAIYAARRRPPRRRRAGGARGRRPGRDRARRLGPVPQHRRRPPDVDQRPARHDVRLARRRWGRRRSGGAAARAMLAGCRRRARRAGAASPRRPPMRSSPAGACRRSARSGCSPPSACCRRRPALAVAAGAAGGRDRRHAARSLGADAARLLAVVRGGRPADGVDDGAAGGRAPTGDRDAPAGAAGRARSPRPCAAACAPR